MTRKEKAPRSGAFGLQRFPVLVLLLAEILVAGAAGLADRADRGLLSSLVAASGNGDQGLDRLLEVVLGLLELGRLAPDRRQGGGFYANVPRALGEAVPGHPAQGVEHGRVERDGFRVVGNLARSHAGQRAGLRAVQGRGRRAMLETSVGLDL